MARKQRVRLTSGKRPNLWQTNFRTRPRRRNGKRIKKSIRSDRSRERHLPDYVRAYDIVRKRLTSNGYTENCNSDSIHHDYYEKVIGQTVFFVHLPSEQVMSMIPESEWIVTMYVAKLDGIPASHDEISEKHTFGINRIKRNDAQGFLNQQERKLLNGLVHTNSAR